MALTLHDIKPIGLCITTEELFDTRRFILNYCDGLILRGNDVNLANELTKIKREMNAFRTQNKFLEGYKAIITCNIDKILGLVASRYFKVEPNRVDKIIMDGKTLVKKIINTKGFEEMPVLEAEFKSKITLPIYELFITELKKANITVI
ncbi:MAG: hypothetical protein NTW30_00095 [Candidatus Aenigmarchaeota archaeon]|nr:hypothetical protein [Candidatus Aenigmarchaeota archaeon]